MGFLFFLLTWRVAFSVVLCFLISGQPALHLYRKKPTVCLSCLHKDILYFRCLLWKDLLLLVFAFWCQMQRCLCLWQWLSCYCRLSLRIRYLSYIRSVSIFLLSGLFLWRQCVLLLISGMWCYLSILCAYICR